MKTVSQFIEELKSMPQDAPIVYHDTYVFKNMWPTLDKQMLVSYMTPDDGPKGVEYVVIEG